MRDTTTFQSQHAGLRHRVFRDPAPEAIRLFNRACAVAALLFIAASHFVRPPGYQDFTQYYMGGLVARHGAWEALYPTMVPGSIYNPGWHDQSEVHPRYLRLARQHGVDEFGFRFIQSPPVAVMFAPLTMLEYKYAHRTWMVVLALCFWGVALQAGAVLRVANGRDTRLVGVAILVVACSVLGYRAVRTGNVSALVGLCIGAVILDLVRGKGIVGGLAMAVGAFAKYATPVLLPLHIFTGKWRPIAWAAGFGFVIVGISLLVSGIAPFEEFFTRIAPTLGRSHPTRANQSIEGLLLRSTGYAVLPRSYTIPLRAVQVVTIVVIMWLIIRNRRQLLERPSLLFASAAALVCWLLIFGPLFWEHYPVYLCPLWGWLIWECGRSILRAVLAILAIALSWVPLQAVKWLYLPEIVNSFILISTLLILVLALWRLAGNRQSAFN